MATKIVIDADVEKFVDSIDKASESIEYFAKAGNKAIDDVGDSYKGMTEKQKRSFDASKKQFEDNVKKMKELEKEYENLRKKQKSGQKLTEDEFNRLKKISKEYKNYKGAVGQTSREMEKLAKSCKNVKKGENDIKATTPQVTHQMANLAAEAINVKTAVVAATGALASFGLDMEKQVAQLEAMRGHIGDATSAYRLLNDAASNTNFDAESVKVWGRSFIDLGYSASEAAGLIGKVSDAISGIGGDTSKAEELVDTLHEIRADGELTMEHIERLQEMGFKNIFTDVVEQNGGDRQQIFNDMSDGLYKGTQGFDEIISSLERRYSGATEKAMNNTVDKWTQAMSDMKAGVSELGSAIVDSDALKYIIEQIAALMKNFKEASRDFKDGIIGPFEYLRTILGDSLYQLVKLYALYKGVSLVGAGISKATGAYRSWKDSKKLADSLGEVTKEAKKMGGALVKSSKDGGKAMNDFLITSAEMAVDTIAAQIDKIGGKIDEIEENKKYLEKQRDAMFQGRNLDGGIVRPGDFENNQRGIDGFNEEIKKNKRKQKELEEKQKKWTEFLKKNKKDAVDAAEDVADAIDIVGARTEKTARKGKKARGVFTQFGRDIKAMFLKAARAAENFGKFLCSTQMISNLKLFGLKFVKYVAGPLGLFLAWLDLVSDRKEDFDKGNLKYLYERASAGEGALDPEDKEDLNNKGQFAAAKLENDQKLKKEIEKANADALEMQKDAAERAKAKFYREKEERELAEKAEMEAARSAAQEAEANQKQLERDILQLKHESETLILEQHLKMLENKMAADVNYYNKLADLLSAYGAEEAAEEQKIANIRLAGQQNMLKAENDYERQLTSLNQKRAELEQAIDLSETETEVQSLSKQIENIDMQLNNLMENHKNDVIRINIETNIDSARAELAQKVSELAQNRAYEKDGKAGEITQFGNMMYNGLQAGTLTSFNENSQALAEAQANGDSAGIMSIGQMLGLSVEEIQAKGEAIQDMYSVVQEAMINATATEIDMNNQAFEAVNEHAENVKKLQDVVTDYCMGIANNFAGAFSDWIIGAKTAGQAIKDFAATLIQNIIQMAAQFAGLCGILAAFGVIPPGPVAAKMMFGYNSGHTYDAGSRGEKLMKKANGGYITGPGTSTSDSIPAMLSAGEYVLNARAVKAIGVGNLNMMNNAHTPRFAEGGLVGHNDAPAPAPVNNVTLQVNAVDATSFAGFLKRGGLNRIKQALFDDSRNFAAMDGVY